MKKIISKLLIAICLLLSFTSLKAQDDPNLGIYVDDVKVTELTCFSFKKMTLVFPYKSSMDGFDFITITATHKYENPYTDGATMVYKKMSIAELKTNNYIKGNYIVYELFNEKSPKNGQWPNCDNDKDGNATKVTRGRLQYGDLKSQKNPTFIIQLYGQTRSGTTESYSSQCNCYVKSPTYVATEISNSITIPILNKESFRGQYPQDKKVDLSLPCEIQGVKVDFNNLGGKSGSSTSNTKTEEKTTSTTKTTVTKTTTETKSSTAPTNSAIKPLDKTKPGYFTEKEGSQITLEGYKKGGKLNGEARSYDDGKLRAIAFYVNDEKNGPSTSYYDNGKIEMTGNYKNGEKDGEWKEYNSDGKLISTKKYVNGEVQD